MTNDRNLFANAPTEQKHPDYDQAMQAIHRTFGPRECRRIFASDDPSIWIDVEISPVPGRIHHMKGERYV